MDITLLNFLKTPVKVENQDIMMSDMIRLYTINKDKYKTELNLQSKKIFDTTFKGFNYKLEINNELFLENTVSGITDKWIESSQYILSQDSSLIMIKLRMGVLETSEYTTEYTAAG